MVPVTTAFMKGRANDELRTVSGPISNRHGPNTMTVSAEAAWKTARASATRRAQVIHAGSESARGLRREEESAGAQQGGHARPGRSRLPACRRSASRTRH